MVRFSPTELGTCERWTSEDPGEVRTWTIAEGERAAAAARWAVEDGFVLAGGYPVEEEVDDVADEDVDPDEAWDDVEYFPVRVTLVDGVAGVDPAPEHLAEPVDGIRSDRRWCVRSGGVTHLLDPDVRGTAGGDDD